MVVQDVFSSSNGGTRSCVGAVGILSAQNDQPGRLLVRYIQRGSGADVQTCKRFLPAQLFQPGFDLLDHVGFGYLRCAVLRSFAQGRAGVEPVTISVGVGVKVCQRAPQGVEGIVEIGDVFAGLDHT